MNDHHCVVALMHTNDAVIACCAQLMRKYGISRLNFVYKKGQPPTNEFVGLSRALAPGDKSPG